MRAAFLTGVDAVEVREAQAPTLTGATDVLVETSALSLCMSDIEMIRGEMKTKKLPIIIGHEGSGTVVSAGVSSGGIKEGDRVLIDPNIRDFTCPSCKKGLYNLCVNGGLMGREADGVFRDRLVLPSTNLYRLPPGISDEVAPLIQPLSTAVHAHSLVHIGPGDTVLVLGLGVTGLLLAQVAKLRGGTVIAVSSSDERLELARRVGADVGVRKDEAGIASKVKDTTQGKGVDVVIDSSGYPTLLQKSGIELVRPGGTVLLFAVRMAALGLDSFEAYRREITFRTARSSLPQDFKDAITMVDSKMLDLQYQISGRFKFDQLSEALSFFQGRRTALKTVITMR